VVAQFSLLAHGGHVIDRLLDRAQRAAVFAARVGSLERSDAPTGSRTAGCLSMRRGTQNTNV
jgi:hypothetical protein